MIRRLSWTWGAARPMPSAVDHRLQHVVDQRLHPRVGHVRDGGCRLEQDGLAQQGDLAQRSWTLDSARPMAPPEAAELLGADAAHVI